ncbi:hypothetical protein CAEBREN_22894 [Caenorhabditis brenneri]|uniref:Uncharacterized protein n=1 Tax=Caenorhabditis brenneri TaxID=135651 RepID=G0NXN9_CAEBE|nr:hypothetical protein CAEBREN_22894 [Caenorhabditis brenneri]
MDEKSRISSSQQPSTSNPPTHSESSKVATELENQTQSDVLKKREKTRQQQQPSTSKTFKRGTCEFGYTDALPFAPWRRKRYGLTVQGLHEEIVDMYHWIKPNEIESRLRYKVYEKVRLSLLERWKHKPIKVSMFGSLRTTLFLPTSDIDVLVECDEWIGTPGDWLTETARGLEIDNIAESVSVYGGAFVPIVKMVDRDTRLSIDISFNTVQGVRAASYIDKVKEEFPLIEPLVLLLKQFLHYRNLNQTFTGGLSSYGLVLLLVNFFQLYALNMRHRTIYDRGVNLGHLLLRFLEVYSLEFNYEEIGISPGQCCYVPKSAAGARYGLKRAQPGNLALEDPLLTANDVGRSTYNFSSIANAFGQAFQILLVAVTLRERKGRKQITTNGYKGSLLHMIMPFTQKELTYRNWLMSGVMTMPQKETAVTYDLNQLHNTLVSPMVDLSRYAWLRKSPAGADKRDARPLKITNPIDVKSQVLEQLLQQEKKAASEETEKAKKLNESQTSVSSKQSVETEEEDASSEEISDRCKEADNGLILTGPPLPTSTASVNTSATVSTAASGSERDDTDSPSLGGSSMGTPSSEEEEEDSEVSNKSSTDGTASIPFKKQFSEVVAQSKAPKEFSRRTQTNFEDRKMIDEIRNHQSYLGDINHHHFYHQQQHPNSRLSNYMDYAAAASPGSHKHRQTYSQRNRQNRNHSQGSDGSDGYNLDRWNNGANNNVRGRRGGRAPSNSLNRSRHSSDSRSRCRPNTQNCYPLPPPLDIQYNENNDRTLTEDGVKNSTLTTEEPKMALKYADAVKKKSFVSVVANNIADLSNGNMTESSPHQQTSTPVVTNNSKSERSYRNALAVPLAIAINQPSLISQSQPNLRKDNECGFDTKTSGVLSAHSTDLSHQPQLIQPVNRLQR